MKKTNKKNKTNKAKIVELNAGFTILKIIAIILIISLATAQTVRTIIQARTSTSESETETTEEEATYYLVDSTEIDEETGEYIQVPVPVGYTASQIEGETGVSTGFVIYEGEIDWSEIIVDEDTLTDITVNKVWEDDDDEDGIRPVSIEVNLLVDGSVTDTVTLSDDNSWTYTWSDMPVYEYDEEGVEAEIDYCVEEDTLPYGYGVDYEASRWNMDNNQFS